MKTTLISNTIAKSQALDSDCVSIMFHRTQGSNPVKVNGIPIPDGQTLTISQNAGDLDVTKYEVRFYPGNNPTFNELIVARIVPENISSYCGLKP